MNQVLKCITDHIKASGSAKHVSEYFELKATCDRKKNNKILCDSC